MERETTTYAKPEIRDYGTLKELTAVCATPGSGDSTFLNDANINTTLPGSLNSYCVSS